MLTFANLWIAFVSSSTKYCCRELHVRAARVGAERHAGGLHTPGTGRGGTLHTLVTSCLGRNNNTNHEYFIRKCLLQNYIKLVNGYSWSVGTAQNKTNHYGNLLDIDIFSLHGNIFLPCIANTPRASRESTSPNSDL